MERGHHHVNDSAHALREHDHIGCLRRVGMRVLLVGKVVSAGVDSTVEGQVDCVKGTVTNSNRVHNLGRKLEG